MIVHSRPAGPGRNGVTNPRLKEERCERCQEWPDTHSDTQKEEANEARCGECGL